MISASSVWDNSHLPVQLILPARRPVSRSFNEGLSIAKEGKSRSQKAQMRPWPINQSTYSTNQLINRKNNAHRVSKIW